MYLAVFWSVENHDATTSASSAGIQQPLMQQDAPAKSVGIDGYCADDAFALLMSMNSVSIMVVSIAAMIVLSVAAVCVA